MYEVTQEITTGVIPLRDPQCTYENNPRIGGESSLGSLASSFPFSPSDTLHTCRREKVGKEISQ